MIGLIINAERMSVQKDTELRLALGEVRLLAASAERERIGSDLHDLLGHAQANRAKIAWTARARSRGGARRTTAAEGWLRMAMASPGRRAGWRGTADVA